MDSRGDRDVRLVLHEEVAAGALALVDRVDAVGEPVDLAAVDVFRRWLALRLPGLGEGIAEGSHLIDEPGVRDWDGAVGSDFLEVRRVKLLVVVIACTLPQIRNQRLPGPFLAAILLPSIEGGLASRYPGEVVQS